MELKKGAYEMILRDRHPGAVVRLSGLEEDSAVSGEAEFYTTPLGVVVCAQVTGLPNEKKRQIFGLCIGSEETAIYSDGGDAWCAVMTDHFSVAEILGTTVTVRKDRTSALGQGLVAPPIGRIPV